MKPQLRDSRRQTSDVDAMNNSELRAFVYGLMEQRQSLIEARDASSFSCDKCTHQSSCAHHCSGGQYRR